MPHSDEFLKGFGLKKGKIYGGYILEKIESKHIQIKMYQEYLYPIILVFRKTNQSRYEKLYNDLMDDIEKEHVIYGKRNPYRCIIDSPKHGDIIDHDEKITFHLTGHSYRIKKSEIR
jgi:hypothetical protein